MAARSGTTETELLGAVMLKKLLAVVIVGAIAKVVLDKLTRNDKDAELWAEATDTVNPGR
jgi:hypothetical protein